MQKTLPVTTEYHDLEFELHAVLMGKQHAQEQSSASKMTD
jgi:hypothetical protein